MPRLLRFVIVLNALAAAAIDAAEPIPSTSVGMTERLQSVVLPGSELEPIPLTDSRQPIVVRLIEVYPHGTAFRYELEYYGLEPGEFDLTDYLRRKDGSSTTDLSPLLVSIKSVLPPGQVEPNSLQPAPPQRLGGYLLALVLGCLAWLVVLAAILFVGRRKSSPVYVSTLRGETLADRLRPLVQKAQLNELASGQKAELERLLLAYWRKRLALGNLPPVAAIAQLRQHEEAGPLLQQLERWLHQPGENAAVDLATLLAP